MKGTILISCKSVIASFETTFEKKVIVKYTSQRPEFINNRRKIALVFLEIS